MEILHKKAETIKILRELEILTLLNMLTSIR